MGGLDVKDVQFKGDQVEAAPIGAVSWSVEARGSRLYETLFFSRCKREREVHTGSVENRNLRWSVGTIDPF